MPDYSYINARVRGMKGRLFKPADYEELFLMNDPASVVLFLFNSAYGRFIGSIEKADVNAGEEALRRDLSDTFKRIYEMADKKIKELLAILLGRWDVYNIKTILRGKHINKASEDIMPLLIPTGALSESLLKELAQQEDIKDVGALLSTWGSLYGHLILEGMEGYKKSGDISAIELRLEKFYFDDSFKKLNKKKKSGYYIYRILRSQIDVINIITALRIVKESDLAIYADWYFIENGEVFTKELYQMVINEKGIIDALSLLNTIPLRNQFKIKKDELSIISDLPEMERMLEIGILNRAIALSLSDPLDVSLIIGFIWRKINEVINLRLILRGKWADIPDERLRKMVVI